MELYPIYEENTKISKNIWYSISGLGETPFMRVGHSIVHLKNDENENDKGRFYLIGGANPSGSFNEVYIFDMNTLSWDKFDEMDEFKTGRYEHSCFTDEAKTNIFIFGGSSEQGTLNDLLRFDLNDKNCYPIQKKSQNQPGPRTIHSGVEYKNQLVVFGGGQEGRTPIQDKNLYIYNPENDKWISLDLSLNGKKPAPKLRQGHLMVNHNDETIYVHGGMNDNELYDDLWSLNLKKMEWTQIINNQENNVEFPCARAAHGGISINNSLYIFGGIDGSGISRDDLWKFDLDTNKWSQIEIFGYKPPPRLDFAYCKASFRSKIRDESNQDSEVDRISNYLVIHGGMDTEGNVFDDFFLINLE
jgi:N-acetylneuraminic acid mutarotase